MLNTKVNLFPGHIQSVYYQNILKILTFLLTNMEANDEEMKAIVSMAVEKMTVFLSSGDVEAQERVCSKRFVTRSNTNVSVQISRPVSF